jgi:hypothetical protein
MAGFNFLDNINCEKCGEFIFSRATLADGKIVEKHPLLPVRLRVWECGIQYFCPVCGHVGNASEPGTGGPDRPEYLNIIPNARDDILKLSERGIDASKAIFAPKTEALLPIAKTFEANIRRLIALGDVVFFTSGLLWFEGSSYQLASVATQNDKGGPNVPPKIVEISIDHANLYRNLTKEMRERAIKSGSNRVATWVYYHDDVKIGMESIFSSQIVCAWTAVETLLGDLWEAALNSHPHGLSDLKGVPKRVQRRALKIKNEKNSMAEREKVWSIPLTEVNRVTRGTYDLSNGMGSVLRESFSFVRLEAIREAYSCAFHENFDGVDSALSDNSIDAINIARNVIVHRAGKADQEYASRSKKFPELPQLNVSEQFPLTAEVSNKLITPAISTCAKLIQAVDNWVISN